ncbi:MULTISPECIES: sigma-70 family RNA polymerase sigma factor [Sphingomonadales]|uniref:RNA polymerase sigma factor n=1 Tax=Sphingomonadales TaxID=204457 RepID=UPI000824524D|nr:MULTISPECIES: sigma-70 family RNA polymerase sigma factor [Sphingomonadales]
MTLDLSGCEDRELASLALTRHQPAYRELMRRHKAPVFRLISNSIGDPVEALDLVQDTFVSAFAALARYDGDRPFKLWISRIALNKCRDWARRRKVRSFFTFAQPIEAADEHHNEDPDAFREVAAKSELRRTEAAINQLPFALREILVLRGIEELSQSEAALTLGISEKAAETRLYRARTQLKRLLEEPSVIDGA